MPVANTNRLPPTSSASPARSSACATDRTAGRSNSCGITAQSLASRIGIAARPLTMCRPWVSAYSHAGRTGHSKK